MVLAFQCYQQSSSHVFIDKLIIKVTEWSSHTTCCSDKSIDKNYKLFVIADSGYILNLIWSSAKNGLTDIEKVKNLSSTSSIILQMMMSTLKTDQNQIFCLFMNNYFSNICLVKTLKKKEIACIRTAKSNADWSELLLRLKKNWKKKISMRAHWLQLRKMMFCVLSGRITTSF